MVNIYCILLARSVVAALRVPALTSVRPALIYAGELEQAVLDEDYFDRIVHFKDLLQGRA